MKLIDIRPLYEAQSPESKALGQLINMSNKAFAGLSDDAKDAIREWELANWDRGRLVQGYASGSDLIEEIRVAFAPIREKMREYFGDTIKLYRGQRHVSREQMSKGRELYSFSFYREIAKRFAHGRVVNDIPSEEEIDRAVAQFNRTGFVTFRGYKYKRSSEYPDYFDIYDRGNDMEAGGIPNEELKQHLMMKREWAMEYNRERESQGEVYEIDVPIEKILWLTNNANSKEFIVALNPLER